MTSQRSHVIFCFFWRFQCRGWSSLLSLKIWYPLMSLNAFLFYYCYKISCSWSLPQEQPIATYLAFLVWASLCFFSAIMDSTPPTSKRVKTRAVRSGGRLEGWFSGDNELIERYRFETSTKVINNPKVVCFDWLKSQKLDNVRSLLKDESLRKFLEMKGNIYPYLIRVFYTNLKFDGNNLISHVKSVDMEITYDVWTAVAGLKYSGLQQGEPWSSGGFQQSQILQELLEEPKCSS